MIIKLLHSIMIVCILLFLSCNNQSNQLTSEKAIEVWFHTGQPAEKAVFADQVDRFNKSRNDFTVKLTLIPEGDYNTQVQAAATDGKLPDLLDLDGPYLYNYAWKGHLLPLDDLLAPQITADLLPSIKAQGNYRGNIYSVATFDSGLGLYGNKRKLEEIEARLPTNPTEAWSLQEFNEILEKLREKDTDGQVLDLRMDYRGEWSTYAFSPAVQSGGGDLINRQTFLTSHKVLDGPETQKVLLQFQKWFQGKYIDPNIDASSFTGKRVALSWCGHWEYPRYRAALRDDLIVLPLPDFGKGSRTGMGSWAWAISSKSKHPELAMEFLEFLLSPEEIIAITDANGAVPSTRSAIQISKLYKPGGPLNLFVKQLEKTAIPRPRTPAYPIITSTFQEAFRNIRDGADIEETLKRAVKTIDQDIADNEGYPKLDKKYGEH